MAFTLDESPVLKRAADIINPLAWPAMHARNQMLKEINQPGYRSTVDDWYARTHGGAHLIHLPAQKNVGTDTPPKQRVRATP